MENPKFTVNGKYTKEEVHGLIHETSKIARYGILLLGGINIIIGVYDLYGRPINLTNMIPLLLSCFIWGTLYFWIDKRNPLKNSPLNNKDFQINFFEDCFFIETDTLNNKVGWNYVKKVIETNSHFYFILKTGEGFFAPKCNASDECIAWLQQKKEEIKSNK